MLNFHIEKLNVTYWEQCVHPSSLQTMISMSTNFLLISSPLILQIKSYLLILDNILSGVKISLLDESMIFSHCFQIVLVYLAQLLVCSIGCDVCLVPFIISAISAIWQKNSNLYFIWAIPLMLISYF